MLYKPNINDIAKLSGFSKTTVSRVINHPEIVSKKTRQIIQKIIKEEKYKPNFAAKSLRSQHAYAVGIIVANIHNDFFSKIIITIEIFMAKMGKAVIIYNVGDKKKDEIHYLKLLRKQKVEGIIIVGTGEVENYQQKVGEIPLVFVDRLPFMSDYQLYDTVQVNNEQGSYELVNELIKKGCKKILAITSFVSTTGSERYAGVRRSLLEHGLPVKCNTFLLNNYLGNGLQKKMKSVSLRKYDGIFCGNNIILKNVLLVLKQANIRNIKLAVFDNQDWYKFSYISIISVSQPTVTIGNVTAKLLLDRIKGKDSVPEHKIIPTKLILG